MTDTRDVLASALAELRDGDEAAPAGLTGLQLDDHEAADEVLARLTEAGLALVDVATVRPSPEAVLTMLHERLGSEYGDRVARTTLDTLADAGYQVTPTPVEHDEPVIALAVALGLDDTDGPDVLAGVAEVLQSLRDAGWDIARTTA